MASKRDYYEVLGVNKNANADEIKKAFRKLAFQCHPDHNQGEDSEAKFKEINEAYSVLSDDEKRSAYDRFGHAGVDGTFGQGFGQGFGDFGFGGGFGSIFEDFFDAFGGGGGRRSSRRGADLQQKISITFEEAALGCNADIRISRMEQCSNCSGSGSKPGSQTSRCSDCNGSGKVKRVQQSIFGQFTNITSCPKCNGEGNIITDPCPKCKGSGKERKEHNMKLKVPAGIDNGTNLKLNGQGDIGDKGAPPGDLYVAIEVKPHKFFKRDDTNVIYDLSVNFAQAALGTEVDVPTLYGNEKLKVPAGSQSGKIFTLKGKGIPHLRRNAKGDQLVRLIVATPEKLTKEQRKLFEDLEKSFAKGDKN
ncbi:MAG: molecular chaperone DnaJ [Dehalococcoidales bacterium]|jgi:molecular chaperone DnaJ|nr:molecular chaperone DnaJ [Dehalococcoidales bacterium]NLT28170.1 molecular chaperone DnaJ [Dehalococcoidales bacterium]